MKKHFARKHFASLCMIALLLATAMPLTAGAQTPAEIEAAKKKAAPAKPAPPAARPAPPAARPAPPPAAARPAPPPPAARVAPPRPQPRVAPQRPQPPAARVAPQRPEPSRAVERPRSPAAPGRVNREQRQERVNRAQPNAPPAAAPKPDAPKAAQTPQAPPNAARSAAPATAAAPVSPAQAQRLRRQERQVRAREDRALRAVPPRQRAAKRQEIQRTREQRATQRQQAQQPSTARSIQAQPNALTAAGAPNARVNALAAARVNRGPRRSGQARVTPQAARQGRFAAAFAASPQAANARAASAIARAGRVAPRRAWQSGRRANFVAWYGPVFYPYAYSDIFGYAFWPGGYDDDYWYVAYDDFFDGVFFGEAGQPEEYVGSYEGVPQAAPPTYKAVQDVCKQPGSGITAWPVAEIESKVGLNRDQIQLLGDVKSAGTKAASVFRATCPSENAFPLTPPGRLASMTARLDATLEAAQTVRPALETFYDSLSDEQKERFNAIGPGKVAANAEAREALPADAKRCGEEKPGLTNLPIEQIEDALKPNEQQQADLDKLAEATVKAVGILQGACPAETPLTPPGRLQAIETRLTAMIDAARTVKPALDGFYASLTAEQKARFNRLGRELAQTTTGNAN